MWGNPFEEDDDDEFAGHPPLTKACLNNHLDFTINYLSSLPADRRFEEVNYKNPLLYGDTPLMLAATYGYVELVVYLLKSGARKDITTYKGTVREQIKKKHDRLVESIASRGKRNIDDCGDERIRRALESMYRFYDEEHPEIDLQERDKLARVLEILDAHTDPTNVCVVCHSPNHIRQCSRCRAVLYCSRECQLFDWKRGHKKECAGTA